VRKQLRITISMQWTLKMQHLNSERPEGAHSAMARVVTQRVSPGACGTVRHGCLTGWQTMTLPRCCKP
jgi:hypothetical protein